MGTIVPEDWPDLDDELYYRIQVDYWWHTPYADGCYGDYVGRHQCCVLGGQIKIFQKLYTCKWGISPCGPMWNGTFRIVCITGPFDTLEACQLYED